MKKITFFLLFAFLAIYSLTTAQVAVNTDGSTANSKAMLDIKSSTMGLLVPRMITTQRNTLETSLTSTEKGMMVFDTDLNHFYYYDGSVFVKMSAGVISLLEDADGDTKIEVERTADDDFIYFSTRDTNFFKMSSGRLEVLNTGQSVFIGENAGASDDLSYNGNVFIGYNSGTLNTTAFGNTAIGSQAFSSNVDGISNSAVGIVALKLNSSGQHNSAFARGTLYNNTSGSFNTAVGSNSLYNNTSGDSNTALGYRALYNNETGHLNVGIGRNALYRNTYIDDLVAVGNSALYWNGYGASTSQGHYNTAIGARSMYSNTIGTYNTALGYETLYSNTVSHQNTAVGYQALHLNEGSSNTATGWHALYSNVDGTSNSAFGIVALNLNSSGQHNSAFARGTLYNNTSGSFNTAVGSNSLYNNTSGDSNTALGYRALYNNDTASLNVGIGSQALYENTNIEDLVAVGSQALYWNGDGASGLEGHYNTAIGSRSMYSNKVGSSNTSLGYETLYSNTEGANNTALGYQTLYDNNYGTNNTTIGYQSMFLNDGGNNNTANGMMALYSNVSGHYNTASGSKALYTNTAGNYNTAIGYNALMNATGSDNIAIGANAGDNISTGANNIIIGKDLGAPSATASNQMYLGGVIYGDLSSENIGIGTTSPGGKLHISSSSSVLSILETTNGDADLHIKATGINDPGVAFYANGTYGGSVGYSNAGDYMFLYHGSTLAFNNGSLGIGITTPSEKLHVYSSSGDIKAIIQSGNGDADLHIKSTGTNNATVAYYNNLSFKGSVGYAPTGDYMFIYKGGNIAFKNGRIGIGTLDPQYGIQTSAHICPVTHVSTNLGTSTLAWNIVYADLFYNVIVKSFSGRSLSKEILMHQPKSKKDIGVPGTEDRTEILDPNSLPEDLHDEEYILTGEMAAYNYAANYEQQVQIEELKKLVEQLVSQNKSLQDKIKIIEKAN